MGEIVILVSSLHGLVEAGITFLFTDRHAVLRTAAFYSDVSEIGRVPWALLQTHDFSKDPEDPDKIDRYQAEALVHQNLPVPRGRSASRCTRPSCSDRSGNDVDQGAARP